MRLTPADIRQQQFTERMFRGFDRDEVDRFLDQVAEDYESVMKENALLKEQLDTFEDRSRTSTDLERNLRDALLTTQKLVEEMKTHAKREAEVIVREAELAGERMAEAARQEEARIHSEIRQLKRTRAQLIQELRTTLAHYQALLAAEARAEDGDGQA